MTGPPTALRAGSPRRGALELSQPHGRLRRRPAGPFTPQSVGIARPAPRREPQSVCPQGGTEQVFGLWGNHRSGLNGGRERRPDLMGCGNRVTLLKFGQRDRTVRREHADV